MDEQVTFGGADIDRAAHLRDDDAGLSAAWAHPEAGVACFWKGKPLLGPGDALVWLAPHALPAEAVEAPIFLGLARDGAPRFAADLSGWAEVVADPAQLAQFHDPSRNPAPGLAEGQAFADLRATMGVLSAGDAGNAAMARGMLEWHRTHRFCARCGAASQPAKGGWSRACPSCGASHFPRTDPVVIMLITHGNDVLLGRSPGWPAGMYSLLAGFMEPGETVEAAVRREVMEEASLRVGAVRYLASQPWPFPASLMIGCAGEALERDIRLDPVELDDAIWVSRERCLAAMAGDDPDLKPARKGAIARHLLDMWLEDRS
ncbi:NAD(+) diphosphatase [Roseobacter sp. HKCCA0434]|uniref:NAD(+) diphosphatase n=1 Tax=Roseobacter sp. HKCCA0434 TaxID=3079297 RepID=UPI002905EBB8|nr:NAD(+) diphosphatase [Roseobacter sp. HKCCA0434]